MNIKDLGMVYPCYIAIPLNTVISLLHNPTWLFAPRVIMAENVICLLYISVQNDVRTFEVRPFRQNSSGGSYQC